MRAGIIAAGWGTRLGGGPKALALIGGRALIDLAIEGLIDAGADRVTCIVNEASAAVREHVERAWPRLSADWIVRTTPSSMHSFLLVVERLADQGESAFLVTTVDAVCRPGTAREFARTAAALGGDLALGVTTLVDDEKPLYAVPRGHAEPGRPFPVAELSSRSGASRFVTAGMYWVSAAILSERERATTARLSALRHFLGAVVAAGYPTWGVPVAEVVDVDRPADVATAERLVAGWSTLDARCTGDRILKR
jgi:NDP-sugar pyrophosphorylase family protein